MQQKKDEKLGVMPIPQLMVSLAIPSVIAQLINVLYNIVDRMYIGHIPDIGPVALTGVGVTMPVIMLISAFSAFIGAGGAPLAAIALGKGDRDRAEKILGNGVSILLIFSTVLKNSLNISETTTTESAVKTILTHINRLRGTVPNTKPPNCVITT